MPEFLVLAEKSSAFKKFKTIMGGVTGTFEGHTYRLTHSHGHLMTLKEPQDQVSDPELKNRYSDWNDANSMPWNLDDFKWAKTYIKSKNPRTKRMQSTKADIDSIKSDASDCQAIVIATDNDPSGEGDLLGWEIVNAIHWKKPVYRMRFGDESKGAVTKAFKEMTNITEQMKQGEYLKAEARNRFDFASMQLTRLSTLAARNAGYNVKVIRQGRLKSVVIERTFQQMQAIKNYVKKPYFEVKYKDKFGHVFSRAVKKGETPDFRFTDKSAGTADLHSYQTDDVANVQKTKKSTAPGSLIDLGKLGSLLASRGYSAKEMLATYQKMYEAEIVSYPRTEDTKITQAQYDQLLPFVDKIAQVVGIDPKKLTHRTLRSKHKVATADHGANRPYIHVPSSLDSLKQYGPSGPAIYETLAKNYLSILGEDYEYAQVKANLKSHPAFTTSFNIPIKLGYKDIFDDDESDDKDDAQTNQQLSPTADPFLDEGVNPKPGNPTRSMILNYLKKHKVGTGATRLSTIAQVTSGKNSEIKETRGKFTLTQTGLITAILAENTGIGSVDITKQLFDWMDEVGKFKRPPKSIVASLTTVVKHDKPLILQNAQKLKSIVGEPKGDLKGYVKKDKAQGLFLDKTPISFNKVWGGHTFTDKEIDALLKGKVIEIEYQPKGKHGTSTVKGKLAEQSYKKHAFWGFKPQF